MKVTNIKGDYINLMQFLKFEGLIDTGGKFEWFTKENTILINNEPIRAKRQKLFKNDQIEINNTTYTIK